VGIAHLNSPVGIAHQAQPKGEIVRHGVQAITGLTMPVFEERRFQHVAGPRDLLAERLPDDPAVYRREFAAIYG
jgi:asparagine synthase (glutamine-hydrolysing)